MTLRTPTMVPAQEAGWIALIEIASLMPTGWTLVGGQLVHLHCAPFAGVHPSSSVPLTWENVLYAWVTIDGVGRHLYADGNRPDVATVYPAYGPNHGFRRTIPASAGSHRVCVTASNVGPGKHTPPGLPHRPAHRRLGA